MEHFVNITETKSDDIQFQEGTEGMDHHPEKEQQLKMMQEILM